MSHYKSYPKYKESIIYWVKKVPENWEIAATGRALEPKNHNVGSLWRSTPLLSLTQKGVVNRDINNLTGKTHSDYSTYQIVEKHDLIFCLFDIDETPRTVGLANSSGMITSAYNVFRARESANRVFLYFFFEFIDNCKGLKPFYTGMRKTVRPPEFLKIKIPLPPRVEQNLIAEHLATETARIDALIEKKTRFIELLKEKLISIAMAEQIDGDGEFIRIQHLTQIIQRPVQIKTSEEYEPLGLYNRGRGLFHKPKTLGKDIGDSTFFYIKEGDLILSGQFAWEGAVTIASHEENGCVVSHRYPVLRGKTVSTKYLLALLMTSFGDFLLNDSSRGSAGRNRPLNINMLLGHKIRQPSEKAQKEIEKVFDLKTKIERRVAKSIALLQERRSALITAAVTGQIDVRNAA